MVRGARLDVSSMSMEKRLHELFGDLRKDFCGEISAKSLGRRFGHYGTFLPTQPIKRPASIAAIESNRANLNPVKPQLKPVVRTSSPPEMASTKNKEQLSPPPLAVSDRKSIKKIIIKYGQKKTEIKLTASAASEGQKEELYMYKQHERRSCSSQVASTVLSPAKSPGTILEARLPFINKRPKGNKFSERTPGMNNGKRSVDESIAVVNKLYMAPPSSEARELHTNKDPLTKQERKLERLRCIDERSDSKKITSSKRSSELEMLDLGRLQKRRKLKDASLWEKAMDADGHRTPHKGTVSRSSGSQQNIQTSTCSSCILEGQENGKTSVSSKNDQYEKSYLLLNEARDFKHRADRLMRVKGGEALGTTIYLESVLKFLTVASLWEQRDGEMNQAAMQLYKDTAKLSQYIAVQSENKKNNSTAALAYKAVEIAHLRRAFLKSRVLAGKEHISLVSDAASAFEATRRYLRIMQGQELTTPIKSCLNLNYFSLAKFTDKTRQTI